MKFITITIIFTQTAAIMFTFDQALPVWAGISLAALVPILTGIFGISNYSAGLDKGANIALAHVHEQMKQELARLEAEENAKSNK